MPHDLGARNDPKLVAAERASRGLYKAIWWDLAEMIWENGGYLPLNYEQLAYILRYPTPEEVKAVINDFDLFLNDGERFWNSSALDRIARRDEMSVRRAEGGRKGGNARAAAAGQSTPQADLKVGLSYASMLHPSIPSSLPQALNEMKEMNEKKSLSPRGRVGEDEETRERIFEIFFFKNFADPVGEIERFWDFYHTPEGWKNSNGRRITNIQRTAEEWRPEKTGTRFPAQFLEWYKAVYAAAKSEGDGIEGMLTGLVSANKRGNRAYTLVFSSNAVRDAVANFIEENGLQRGMDLNYGTLK